MCGYCKVLWFYCDCCKSSVSFARVNCKECLDEVQENYSYSCENSDCNSSVCNKCIEKGIKYCSFCIVGEKVLELEIERLQIRNKELKLLLDIHVQFYAKKKET